MLIDLKKFCSHKIERFYLQHPFSFEEFTYASNGAIAIRVPRREEIPEREECSKIVNSCKEFFGVPLSEEYVPFTQALPLSKIDYEQCGCLHDCPDCSCYEDCELCEGTQNCEVRTVTPTILNGVPFSSELLRLIQELPNPMMPIKPKPLDPNQRNVCIFKFDDGLVALMPVCTDQPFKIYSPNR